MEKPKAFCSSFFDEKQIWNSKTMIYDQKEMDAFLAFVAGELKRALACWGDASAELILEETIKDLTGKKKKSARCPACGEVIRHLFDSKTGKGDGGECACTDKKEKSAREKEARG